MSDRFDAKDVRSAAGDYEPPTITALGHLAELTLLGSGGLDELENDGSVA